MPELPDIEAYVRALEPRLCGRRLINLRLSDPFLLRSVAPTPEAVAGRVVTGIGRSGKRVVIGLEDEHYIVIHLMIAGRLRWTDAGGRARRDLLVSLEFESGTLGLTEAGSRRRASLHLAAGAAALAEHDRGGLEPLTATASEFDLRLRQERHTLKRALTDPTLFSGIGNSYSDEILHHARLSPFKLTTGLTAEESRRLHDSVVAVLADWTQRIAREVGDRFPEKVTAFRPGMKVHGRFGQPCPDCGAAVQRVVYAGNEMNYCATCQTEGRLLRDRALSRLLREDWPKTLEELEALRRPRA